MFNAFDAPGRFFRGNLHCHSTRSDGDLSPERVCTFYREAGYDFICLSDHFIERFGFPVTDTSAYRDEAFSTLIGAEIHAGQMSAGEIWHILAVGLPLDFRHTPQDETGPQLAQRALDAGAFVAIAHPEWYALTIADALALPVGVHAIEVHNSICASHGRGQGAYLLDQYSSAGRLAGAIAVDDAHHYQDDALGGWVQVKATDNRPDALLAALKNGAYYASTGAEIHHAEINGTHLMVETSPAARVHLLGQASRSKTVAGNGVTRTKFDLTDFSGKWARVFVEACDGTKAWGNPFAVGDMP